MTFNNLAVLYKSQGRYAQAELLYRRALAIFAAELRPEHPTLLACQENLALLLHAMGHQSETAPLEAHVGEQ
jgi:hypothetical protein